MKPSTELFDLIKSLSKSEKRFFKLSSSLQSGEKNYLKIFDYIERQRKYDEEDLKSNFAKSTFIKHLPSEKNHLYKLVLKSLRAYYSDQSVSSQLKQEIKNVEILYKKALYKECRKFVKRAKKLAIDHEKFYYWFELISWEKKLLEEAIEQGDFDYDIDKLIEEEAVVIAKLRNLAEYQILYSKINHVFRSGGFTRNATERKVVDEIADYHLIKGKNTAISTRATSICYYIKGLCAATNREYDDAFLFFNKVRTILDKDKKLRSDLSKRYVLTIAHLIRGYVDNGNFEEAARLMQEMKDLSKEKGFKSLDIEVSIFTVGSNSELNYYNRKGEFSKSIAMVEGIIEKTKEYKNKISKEQEILFAYNIAYAYFGMEDYKKALYYLNKVLNDNEQHLRQDIYSFSRIFNLIIHYELENYDFLEYMIKSTSRYLNKHEKDYQIEEVFVRNIRKLSKYSIEGKAKDVIEDVNNEISELLKDPNERVILDYFDIENWFKSKIDGISFSEEIKS
jgi:pentatricopeptide repeat protein